VHRLIIVATVSAAALLAQPTARSVAGPSRALAPRTAPRHEANSWEAGSRAVELRAYFERVAVARTQLAARRHAQTVQLAARRPPDVHLSVVSAPWSSVRDCIAQHESENAGGYRARNSSGAGGRYQIIPSTGDVAARAIGRRDLVGVNVSQWTPDAQEAAGAWLWSQSHSHWRGTHCRGT